MDITLRNNKHNEFIIKTPEMNIPPNNNQYCSYQSAKKHGQCIVTRRLVYCGSLIDLSDYFPAITSGMGKIKSMDRYTWHPVYKNTRSNKITSYISGSLCNVEGVGTIKIKTDDMEIVFEDD